MNTIIIRNAEPKDLKRIVQLCKEHADYERAEYDSSGKVSLLENQLFVNRFGLKCLVVEQNNLLIGYATFMKQFSTWNASIYLYLDCLYLQEQCRSSGIGTRIMQKVKEYAQVEKCSQIEWQTPSFNSAAIKFYHKLGAHSNSKQRFCWTIK